MVLNIHYVCGLVTNSDLEMFWKEWLDVKGIYILLKIQLEQGTAVNPVVMGNILNSGYWLDFDLWQK